MRKIKCRSLEMMSFRTSALRARSSDHAGGQVRIRLPLATGRLTAVRRSLVTN